MGCIAQLPVNNHSYEDRAITLQSRFNGLHCPTPCKLLIMLAYLNIGSVSMGCIAQLPVNIVVDDDNDVYPVSMGCIAQRPVNAWGKPVDHWERVSMGCIAQLPVNLS